MRTINLLVLAFVLSAGPAMAADPPPPASSTPPPYMLDLAGGDTTISVASGKGFQFRVIDKLMPEVISYTESLTIMEEDVPPLTFPGASSNAQPLKNLVKTDCAIHLKDLTTALKGAANEAAIKTVIATDQPPPGCDTQPLEDLTKSLVEPPEPLTLSNGQATLVVSRGPVSGDPHSRTWTFKFMTGTQGAWLMHYGFSFLGNRDEAFFAASTTQDGKTRYKITPKVRRNSIQYLPTFTFTYIPAYFQSRQWSLGPVAGLGTDLSNVTAFLGGALIIRQNVNVYVGVAGAKQQRLNGKYHSGDVVMDNLSDDQVNEKVYVPTIIFGVGFRFTNNPFSSGSGSQAPPKSSSPSTPKGGGSGS
jgi:hypothetical protein